MGRATPGGRTARRFASLMVRAACGGSLACGGRSSTNSGHMWPTEPEVWCATPIQLPTRARMCCVGPERESVWDYPRPPSVEGDDRVVLIRYRGVTLADAPGSVRVLETSHPPVFYVSPEYVEASYLKLNDRSTYCEFKGSARYYDLTLSPTVGDVAWTYPDPATGYERIQDRIAFYPSKVDCFLDGEKVIAQNSDFYGGWITSEISGPFKSDKDLMSRIRR